MTYLANTFTDNSMRALIRCSHNSIVVRGDRVLAVASSRKRLSLNDPRLKTIE